MAKEDKKQNRKTVAVMLPGQMEEDADLVKQAVSEINSIYVKGTIFTALEVGEYVLDTFFNNAIGNFNENQSKHASYQMLSNRDDLRFSKTNLHNCVALYNQYEKELPEDVRDLLPKTHQVMLLPLTKKTKIKLARKAAKQNLSKRDLAIAIEKERKNLKPEEKSETRGRKPLPSFIKQFNSLNRVAEAIDFDEIEDDPFGDLSSEAKINKLDEFEDNIKILEKTVEEGRKKLEALRAAVGK